MKLLISLFLLACFQVSEAAIVPFDISPPGTDFAVGLKGANEVPANASPASGNETGLGIFYDTESNILTLPFAYGSVHGFVDLLGDFAAAHIHGPAPPGVAADPPLYSLVGLHTPVTPKTGTFSGTVTFLETEEAALLAGLNYINIHSSIFGGGEIRGQLVLVPEPHEYGLAVSVALLAFATYRQRTNRVKVNS